MHGTPRLLLALVLAASAFVAAPERVASAQSSGARPVIFVHGMGTSAADIGAPPRAGRPGQFSDLLLRLAHEFPEPVCQKAAEPGRPWSGSPCVFRYYQDIADATDRSTRDPRPYDSQSSVRLNADKLAREVTEVAQKTGKSVVLIGYSMGGAIIRTYLATHNSEAGSNVKAVILVDPVASGGWGYSLAGSVARRASGPLRTRLVELIHSLALSLAAVDFDRPASNDLAPGSPLFKELQTKPVPPNIDYYTFWGDIRIVVKRKLLAYDLPDLQIASIGDLWLLPGNTDPRVLPELGGQRFSPPVRAGAEALDVVHRGSIELTGATIAGLIDNCGQTPGIQQFGVGLVPGRSSGPPTAQASACGAATSRLMVPDAHMAIPSTLRQVQVENARLGGRTTLLDAIVAIVARNQ